MENHYKIANFRKKHASCEALSKVLNPTKNSFREEQMILAATNRAELWAKDQMMDENGLKSLKNGMVTLKHESLHNFRAQTTRTESSANIYVRNYMTAGKRAEKAQEDYTSSHLEAVPYNEKRGFLDKVKRIEKHQGPDYRFGLRTENERLNGLLQGPLSQLDLARVDNKMKYSPRWKEVNKKKWIEKKDFNLTTCYFGGRKCKDPWEVIPVGINIGDNYTDGFEVVGDLSRTRKKDLEICTQDFLTTVTPNRPLTGVFYPPIDSVSLRTAKSNGFFGGTTPVGHKTYPKTLETMGRGHDEFGGLDVDGSPKNPNPKPITIKTGGPLDPLRETNGSPFKLNSAGSPTRELTARTTFGMRSRKNKQVVNIPKEEMIKNRVQTYFD